MITLEKRAESAKISLEKKNIFGEKAQVVLVLDISISMRSFFSNGTVQEIVDRVLAMGMNLDDNKSIEVFLFGASAKQGEDANEANHIGYVDRVLKKNSLQGGTRYALPMKMVLDTFVPKAETVTKTTGFFRKKTVEVEVAPAKTADVPTFVIFVTDGDNQDKTETEKMIREASNQAVFWQFVGIGDERFQFLKKLDDMDGRFLDNVDFFQVNDPKAMSDSDLYDKLLNEFPQWIKDARAKNILQ